MKHYILSEAMMQELLVATNTYPQPNALNIHLQKRLECGIVPQAWEDAAQRVVDWVGVDSPDDDRLRDQVLEAIVATHSAPQSDHANSLYLSGYDADGKSCGTWSSSSHRVSDDMSLMTGFLELERAASLRNVPIAPFKLGALWVTSVEPSPAAYNPVRGAAAEAYYATHRYAHPLPVKFRWEELWNVMSGVA